jgi:NTP pyrophosphatase (non-canonical NTP hydrolase)
MKKLPSHASLPEYQKYVAEMVKERGFEDENVFQIFMLLIEELGELAKEIRKEKGVAFDKNSKFSKISLEFGDILNYLFDLANHLNVDLEKAYLEKEELNNKRNWEKKKS